ncbi:MAG: peptide deformylase, partial [Cyanobacteria bacterium P01_F01_bin.116]
MMGHVRSVIKLGDKRLRSHARPVRYGHEPGLQQLIDDLISTTADKHGVGIAAPQVAEGIQLFIVAS